VDLVFKCNRPTPITLEDFTRLLVSENIIKHTDGEYKLLKDKIFKEIGLGIFLAWFYSKTDRDGTFYFVKVNPKKTLFLSTHGNRFRLNHNHNLSHYSEDIFFKTPTGNMSCLTCPVINWFKYNHGIIKSFGEEIDFPEIPYGGVDGCRSCKSKLKKWFVDKLKENENFGKILGGFTCVINAPPKIFKFFFSPSGMDEALAEENTMIHELEDVENPPIPSNRSTNTRKRGGDLIETIFNAYLVMMLGMKYNFTTKYINASLKKPFETHELDGVLWNDEKKELLVLETSREKAIDGSHLKHKMYNSVLMHLLNAKKYLYLYITLGNVGDDFIRSLGHVELAKKIKDKYDVPFEIIDMPKKYLKLKNLRVTNKSDSFRALYNHYLSSIDSILEKYDFARVDI